MDSQALDPYTAAKRIKDLHEQFGGVWALDPATGEAEPLPAPALAILRAPKFNAPKAVIHLPERREPVARPRERRAQRSRVRGSRGDPDEGEIDPDRAHALDRMVSAATWRAKRAREGKGYKFELPPSLRGTA